MSKAMTDAWMNATPLVDETEFTPWAEEGWLAWNGQSPEMAVCGFVQSLVQMMQPQLIIETGVGQGYMTRAIALVLEGDQTLISYESDADWRSSIWQLPFWQENRFTVTLAADPTPTPDDIGAADLIVLDSDWEIRFPELETWFTHAKQGAVAVIHDVSGQPDTIHQSMRDFIQRLGITGFYLRNPRGCFVAVKGGTDGQATQNTGREGGDEEVVSA